MEIHHHHHPRAMGGRCTAQPSSSSSSSRQSLKAFSSLLPLVHAACLRCPLDSTRPLPLLTQIRLTVETNLLAPLLLPVSLRRLEGSAAWDEGGSAQRAALDELPRVWARAHRPRQPPGPRPEGAQATRPHRCQHHQAHVNSQP